MFGLQHPIDLQGMTRAKPEVGALARAARPRASAAVAERSRLEIHAPICNHSFRATGITAYVANGGALGRA
jgi:hypothetical protein